MVNMLKVLTAVVILLAIIGLAMLGKKLLRALIFRTAKTHNNESKFIEIVLGLLVIIIALTNYIRQTPEGDWVMAIGALLFFVGGIIQLLARKQLYDDKTQEDRLGTEFAAGQTGLYSKIRHPSKLALLLILIGFCLALKSYWALGILFVLFFPSMLYRISQEEKALLDKFGNRWQAYKSDSKKLIPGIL